MYDVLDASGGYASACLGAGHPVVKQALLEAVEHSGYVTDEVHSLERSLLLTRLFGRSGLWIEQFPEDEYHVSGRNSGSEGMELALRLVLEHNFDLRSLSPRAGREKRRTILAFEGAWHGWTAGILPLLNRRHFRVGLPDALLQGPMSVNVEFLPFAEVDLLEQFFAQQGDTLAAVFVEPLQGDAGIIVPPPGYLRRLAELCQKHGVLLVADEVMTFAKTGKFFAMADEDGPISTDITVIGKSLGMGVVSTSFVIARRMLYARPSGAVSTSDLRPLTCALIHAGLEYIVEGSLLAASSERGEDLRALLQSEVVCRFPQVYREVRGAGLLNGIEVTEQAAPAIIKLRTHLIEHGIYVEFMAGAGRRSRGLRYVFPTMRVAPPLIASSEDIVKIVAAIQAGTRAFIAEDL
jgi:ornithine--oxo-acid transaminase